MRVSLPALLTSLALCVPPSGQSQAPAASPEETMAVDLAMDMKHSATALDMNPRHLIVQQARGHAAKLPVPVTNIRDATLTIKDVVIEDRTGAFSMGEHQLDIVLAPAETYEVPLIFTPANIEAKARIRIISTTGSGGDLTTYVLLGYSQKKKMLSADKRVTKAPKAAKYSVKKATKMKGERENTEMEAQSVRLTHFVPGKPSNMTVPLKNPMSTVLTVRDISVEDKSRALTLGGVLRDSVSVAPGEQYDIPVTLTARKKSGKARIRIVGTTEGNTKPVVQHINIAYE
jgi:hypothetical protein